MYQEYKSTLKKLVEQGYSIIPVDEKKKALISWKTNQEEPLTLQQIESYIDQGVQNYALVCGKNNLECIDVDTKNLNGAISSGDFYDELVNRIPLEIWSKLVVQKTPSGGKHFYYRCSVVEGNQHLLKVQSSKPIIETRGSGGYALIAPSTGYKVEEGEMDSMQEISADERKQLFDICTSMSDLFETSDPVSIGTETVSFDEDTIKLVESCLEQIEAKELDLTVSYDNWIRIGFSLAYTFREEGLDYFQRVSKHHSEYDPLNCEQKYFELLEATTRPMDNPITIKTFFEFCRKAGIKLLSKSDGKIARKFLKVMRYLETKEVKFNEFTRKTEIYGEELSDRHINSIYADLQEAGVPASKDYINTLMLSSRTQDYHPIRDFLYQSVEGGFGNEIDQLLRSLDYTTIIEDEQDLIDSLVIKWLLQIPAVVYDEIPPRLVLVLIGPSHIGKTHFFRHLLPPELTSYYAESDLSRGKDSMILMSEKLLINNDEFGGIMKMNEMEHFKRIASAESFDERRAYGRFNEKFRRRAVLSGTSNRFEVIMDHTAGNTRIIPVEINEINHDLYNAVDKSSLMAEIVSLYRELGRDSVKLNASQRQSLEEFSKNYETINFEHEAILEVCRPGERFYPTIAVANAIKNQIGIAINPRKLAQALKMLDFIPERKRIDGRHRRGWKMDLFGPASRFEELDSG